MESNGEHGEEWSPSVATRRSPVYHPGFDDHGRPRVNLDDLTPSQRQAVQHVDGPLLVLAGPGSGKTRVVTRRIAHLVEQGVHPGEILAITFTNKAAREMQERVDALLPGTRVFISTFHRFCARLLRRHADHVGLHPNYTIADTTDQRALLRVVLDELDVDGVHFPAAKLNAAISKAKNDLLRPDDYTARFAESIGNHEQAVVARVYPAYQKRLLEANSVDFDDLLLHVHEMLRDSPELRRDLDERFRYVLVDEYQDTNAAQYEIVRALSIDKPNLCVTGDPDQSIYGWRGAKIENILRFERDYPGATVVRLQENFRSTKAVLRAADALIVHNKKRKAKSLVTDNDEGPAVELRVFRDARHEAESIAADVRRAVESGERTYSDFAVCYRVNSLSREIEVAFRRDGVPSQVAAGVSFFERVEVKDVLAYLKLALNPADRVAFRRIVNKPVRGIGKKSVSTLLAHADAKGLTPLEAASKATAVPGLTKRGANALARFAEWYDSFDLANAGSVAGLLRTIVDRTGYTAAWKSSSSEDDLQRLANVEEMLAVAARYDAEHPDDPSLEAFLESVSLASEVDSLDPDAGEVTLMTLHAAKGLEFPVVYLVGVEHNLLPHERSLNSPDGSGLEEERRLLFVGMTRAREQLVLTRTERRDVRGRSLHSIPSDFLREMQSELLVRDLARDEFDVSQEAEPTPARRHTARTRPEGQPLLTTGAALLDGGRRDAVPLPVGFALGMQVRHPRYGRGTIVDLGGYSKHRTVTVEFETDARRETFVAAKSPLQPIGVG